MTKITPLSKSFGLQAENAARLEFESFKPLKDVTRKTLQRLSCGDHSAYETVFLAYYSPLEQYTAKIIRNEEDAREIVQEVFIRLYNNSASIDPDKNIKGYLYRTAKFLILDYFKQKKVINKYRDFEIHDYKFATSADDEVIAKELQILVAAMIESMPEKRREVVRRYYEQGKTLEEIARELDMAVATARKHLTIGKKEIQELFKAYLIIFLLAQL